MRIAKTYLWKPGFVRLLGHSVVLLAALLLLPGTAGAMDVTVNCPGESINAALETLQGQPGPHTVTVTGTCEENVTLWSLDRLTIQAPEGQTATVRAADPGLNVIWADNMRGISLCRLVVTGGVNGVYFESADYVRVTDCSIEGNAWAGIASESFHPRLYVRDSVLRNGGVGIFVTGAHIIVNGATIEDHGWAGIFLGGSEATIRSSQISGNDVGLRAYGSTVGIEGTTFENNRLGIYLINAAGMTIFGEPTVIEGNTEVGLAVHDSSGADLHGAVIRNNGGAEPNSSGIWVSRASSIVVADGTEISSNVGPGILADPSATIQVADSNISGNAGDGIRLRHLSVGEFLPGNSIVGNGGAAVACDSTSIACGNLTGIFPVRCRRPEN